MIAEPVATSEAVADAVRKFWGYDSLLPLQREAMQCVLQQRDSVVVLPTGGGKSLCFQAPAVCARGLAVVVSPLISLMKDQVDALQACGIAAACANSAQSTSQQRRTAEQIRAGQLSLLYVAPERLLNGRTIEFLKTVEVSLFAIDEAHCISSWGHDFRPEYRGLSVLKQQFPRVGIHAYTATASEQVRHDIAEQLRLSQPEFLVGSFDRPNLVYRVKARSDGLSQIREVLDRHPQESGIVYCISRKDVERTAAALNQLGYRALPYHAGLEDRVRKENQEAFIQQKIDTIVATVAFGMGIDKSNVRYVVHAAMPKSLESYQQESGRAGRDGLEAECWMFYSAGDFVTWKRMMDRDEGPRQPGALTSLQAIASYCSSVECRHKLIVSYFGQTLESDSCGACDVCLDELDVVEDAMVLAQKLLSCVLRLQQRYGGDYTSLVLVGSQDQRILQQGHDKLSTWGLLAETDRKQVRDWIEQLASQGYLSKVGDYNVLQVTDEGRRLLRGEVTPRLLKPTASGGRKSNAAIDSWEGVDQGLFEELRGLRRGLAESQSVPAYVIFSDASLRDMARRRPSTADGFRKVKGVGEKKCSDFGELFTQRISAYCMQHQLAMDVTPAAVEVTAASQPAATKTPNASALAAFPYFQQGLTVPEVAGKLGRAISTTHGYLAEYLRHEKIVDWSPWVDSDTADRVTTAIEELGNERLKPIFEILSGEVSYEQIRVVATCLRNRQLVAAS